MSKLTTLVESLKKQLALLLKQQSDLNRLQPLLVRKSEEIMRDMVFAGIPVRVVEGYRTIGRQNELYAQGRTKPGSIVTNAKGGESFHNWGVAFDMVFVKEGYNATNIQWETLGKIGKKYGLEWGGDWLSFPDKPHFQLTFGHTLQEFQKGKVDYSIYK